MLPDHYGLTWREHLAALPLGVLMVDVGRLLGHQRLDSLASWIGVTVLTWLVGASLIVVYKLGKQAGRRGQDGMSAPPQRTSSRL